MKAKSSVAHTVFTLILYNRVQENVKILHPKSLDLNVGVVWSLAFVLEGVKGMPNVGANLHIWSELVFISLEVRYFCAEILRGGTVILTDSKMPPHGQCTWERVIYCSILLKPALPLIRKYWGGSRVLKHHLDLHRRWCALQHLL